MSCCVTTETTTLTFGASYCDHRAVKVLNPLEAGRTMDALGDSKGPRASCILVSCASTFRHSFEEKTAKNATTTADRMAILEVTGVVDFRAEAARSRL